MIGGEFASVVLGLASAASWGTADFSGGLASKRANPFSVVITSQIVGVLMLLGLALVFDKAFPPVQHLLLGGVGGIVGALSLLCFYTALATGRMGVAAPVTAVMTALIPALVGAFIYGLPDALKLVGFGLALLGIWLISQSALDGRSLTLRELLLPLAAGTGFGILFVIIDQVNDVAIFWPLVAARVASLTMMTSVTLLRRQRPLTEASLFPLLVVCGILDAGGNAFYALAAQAGRLDVAGVLGSLYPAATITLAWLVLKEPITRVQTFGIIAALTAVVLIAL